MIPELTGNKIYTVRDRMNARYFYRADVWHSELADARAWGVKYADIVVVSQ
jgi:3D (Asp-Asp-Asp) domain-containing protein